MYILFICTGNTCRSSMAEGIMNYLISSKRLNDKITCSSAGIAAFTGDTASEYAISVLKNEWKIDISEHRSRQATKYDLDRADIILTMTKHHKNQIISLSSEYQDKVYTLKEHTGTCDGDIVDPYGQAYTAYKACASELWDLLQRLIISIDTK